MIQVNRYISASFIGIALIFSGFLNSCHISNGADKDTTNDLRLPAIKVDTTTAYITKDYMGSIEGKVMWNCVRRLKEFCRRFMWTKETLCKRVSLCLKSMIRLTVKYTTMHWQMKMWKKPN